MGVGLFLLLLLGLGVALGVLLMEERGYWLYSNFEDKRERNG